MFLKQKNDKEEKCEHGLLINCGKCVERTLNINQTQSGWDRKFSEVAKEIMPNYIKVNGQRYFLDAGGLMGGTYRISYVKYKEDDGETSEKIRDRNILDNMSDDPNMVLFYLQREISKIKYEITDKHMTKDESFNKELEELLDKYGIEQKVTMSFSLLTHFAKKKKMKVEISG